MNANMYYTKKAFLEEIQEAIPARDISVDEDEFSFDIDVDVHIPAWNRAVHKAEAIRDKWVKEGYDVRMSTFVYHITFSLYYD